MTSSNPNHLPKASSPNTIVLGVRTTTYELGENANIWSIERIVAAGDCSVHRIMILIKPLLCQVCPH